MFDRIIEYTIFQNSLLAYLKFLGVFLCGILFVRIGKKFILARVNRWVSNGSNEFLHYIISTAKQKLLPILYFGVFYLSLQGLVLSPPFRKAINWVGLAVVIIFGVRFGLSLVNYWINNYLIKKETDPSKKHILRVISIFIQFLAWTAALIVFLDNLGIKISTLLAGLGIGGIAVALAAQVFLSDLFSYFTIYFDRPFEIGDFIIIDGFAGTVENIGIKTTRLRSRTGEQLIFSNADLTSSRLRNYKRMVNRRIDFEIGVSYQTSSEQLKEIPELIAAIIKSIPETRFDRSHFASFGEYSLRFVTVYYVTTSDYRKYMDIQQEINLRIIEEFEKRGIYFTYPTQNVYLKTYD